MNVVKVGDRRERVFLKEPLGQGSMADVHKAVVRGEEMAVKIYRYDDPSKEPMRPIRARKIPLMTRMSLPDNIFPPKEVVYSDQNEFLGFTMNLFPPGYVPLGELYAQGFWAKQFITPSKALLVIKGVHAFISGVHGAELIIVDPNPGNIQFHLSRLQSIISGDADSYQIPGFIGLETHLDYASLRLGNGLGQIEVLPEDDWWSFYIHYLTALTRGGFPFRAKGKWFKQQKAQYPTVQERVAAGISIFNEQAETLGPALPIEILPEEVLQHLFTVMIKEKRAPGPMPEWLLDIQFQECPVCHREHARKSCPYCHKVIYVPRIVPTVRISVEEIFKSDFAIIEAKVVGSQIVAIIRTRQDFEVVKLGFDGGVVKNKIGVQIDPGQEYTIRIGDDLVGIAAGNNLFITDHNGREVERTTTTRFMNRPVFALGKLFYRGVGSKIMTWQEILGVRRYKAIATVPIGSTWYQATDQGLVIITYVNGRYDWTLLQGTRRRKIEVQPLTRGQYIINQSAVSDDKSLVILRVVEDRDGELTTLIDQFNLSSGVVSYYTYPDPLYQVSCFMGVLFFASDEGLMKWKLGGGEEPRVLPETENVVTGGDKVFLKDKGTIVLVKNQSIDILRAR